MTDLYIDLAERGYTVSVGKNILHRAGELFNLDRRVLVVTDSGVPAEYAMTVASCAREAKIVTLPEGEGSKSPETFTRVLTEMLDFGLTRTDCAVAVGGGVVGDLVGFCAASYMRGIDFYNVPTTLLSQVDSSIGGKTAINLSGVKNVVGAFYQPKGVLIDADTLKTLPSRQIANGMAEAIKMAITSDADLFELIEREGLTEENTEEILLGALRIKKAVVEADERECGLRRVLNFGHTLGHGIEAREEMRLYHGECVAIGMTAVCSDEMLPRLRGALKRFGLPTEYDGDLEGALSYICHDKKCDGSRVSVVFSDDFGSFRLENMTVSDFCDRVRERIK